MRKNVQKFMSAALLFALAMPAAAMADEQALQLKVDELTKKVDKLQEKTLSKWLEIGGDYRFRVDSLRGETKAYVDAFATLNNAGSQLQGAFFANPTGIAPNGQTNGANLAGFMAFVPAMQNTRSVNAARAFLGLPSTQGMLAGLGNFAVMVPTAKPKNDSLYTNRLGLDLHVKATKDITVNVRLVAYKTFGSGDDSAVMNGGATPYFADRVGVFDATIGHVPSSNFLDVDRAYATWSNIAELPIWMSVGRRPSTNGAPSNLRLNAQRPGNGGTPSLLVDYAFDGMTIGYAPDIEMLPGAYAKICYGRAFESGFDKASPVQNKVTDTDMMGIAIIPVDTDPLRVWLQWNRGMNVFDAPVQKNTFFGDTGPSVDLGSIDWYGAGAMSTLKNIGPGDLNFFLDGAISITEPNGNVSGNAGFEGLNTGSFFNPETPSRKTGWGGYVGARYDFTPSKTKLGFEYNHGSKNWIPFIPAADDMWTAKLGTRGDVYEAYVIQELNLKPISSYLAKAFFRVGYQYYNFEYTGSNNWVGAPVKISDIKPGDMLLMAPLKNAQDIYATFEVKF